MNAVITRRQALRRTGALALGAAAWPLLAACGGGAKKVTQPARIGVLIAGTLETAAAVGSLRAFREGMAGLGYVEGRDFTIELRVAEGRVELLPGLAAELVGVDVDLILTSTTAGTRAATQATRTIPIVFANLGDPVVEGLVESLARPGGNATGLTLWIENEYGKRLELLKEVSPGLSRAAYMWSRTGPQPEFLLKQMEDAARTLRVQLLPLEARSLDEVPTALKDAIAGGADGLTYADLNIFLVDAPQIVDFARTHRLPAIHPFSSTVRLGGLMSYGTNIAENWRRAATYVDKILKGANPGEIPIERPTKFEFVINLKAAQAIGLTFPRSVLQQAAEVIS